MLHLKALNETQPLTVELILATIKLVTVS
jgi:hypothetical protein